MSIRTALFTPLQLTFTMQSASAGHVRINNTPKSVYMYRKCARRRFTNVRKSQVRRGVSGFLKNWYTWYTYFRVLLYIFFLGTHQSVGGHTLTACHSHTISENLIIGCSHATTVCHSHSLLGDCSSSVGVMLLQPVTLIPFRKLLIIGCSHVPTVCHSYTHLRTTPHWSWSCSYSLSFLYPLGNFAVYKKSRPLRISLPW